MFLDIFSGLTLLVPIGFVGLICSLVAIGQLRPRILRPKISFDWVRTLDGKVFGNLLYNLGKSIEVGSGIVSFKMTGSISRYIIFAMIGFCSLLATIVFG